MPEKPRLASCSTVSLPSPITVGAGYPGAGDTTTILAGASTTLDLLTWVRDELYLDDEAFQTYHARMHNAREAEGG